MSFSKLAFVPLRLILIMTSVKRHAEAKEDTLGPHWTHWVSKAITKLVSKKKLTFIVDQVMQNFLGK